MTNFGPFSVSGAQITALGAANFSQFVNRLLAAETAAHGMAGTSLETTYVDNVGDGGVDAGLRQSTGTTWIPAGESAWQFKAGDCPPSKCKTEIAGATKAQEILRAGGHYRLVLGKSLNSEKLATRRDSLIEKVTELGISVADGTIDVLAADALARWVEQYPALAVSPLLGGVGSVGQTFEEWANSNRHASLWTPSESRDLHIDDLRAVVTGGDQIDIHIEGVSGLGKTRLVMEALRGQPIEALVVYAPAADQFPVAILSQLQVQGRSAVVVIDECDSKSHEIYASVLANGTSLRLITIGEPVGSSTRSPMIGLPGLENDAMTKLLRQNQPGLWPEATNVIVEVAAGNIDYALKASKALVARESASAGALVTAADIRSFITDELPDGALFLACCVLALFSRLGFDGEVASELTVVASSLKFQERELRSAARALEERRLLTRQGRFRSVGPQPVALYLASRAWAEFGEAIVQDLLPLLDPDLTERLFRRATEIGDPDTARLAVERTMAPEGPLGSWESLLEEGNARLLVHLAVLAPMVTAEQLEQLIGNAADEELMAFRAVRRDLVWTLEKLAWHRGTFETAANLLLRLALTENENYANNATGTWVDLFGTMLPGTAATPAARIRYLAETAEAADQRIRHLAVRAAAHALDWHQTITVSGELQGGAVVEPRGTPETYGKAWDYRNEMIDLLRRLVDDSAADVAAEALNALVAAIHGSLEIEANRTRLGEAFATLDGERLRLVRTELGKLQALFDRADVTDGRAPGAEALAAMLPAESDLDRLWALAHTHSWDRENGALLRELIDTSQRLDASIAANALLEILASEAVPAAYEVGRTLAVLASHKEAYLSPLAADLDGSRADAAVGYLWELIDNGTADAFDSFIDRLDASPSVRLGLTARGPKTDSARVRAEELVIQVSVHDGARMLFRWLLDAEQGDIARQVEEWRSRLSTQDDYNAVVDLLALYLHRRDIQNADLQVSLERLVADRRAFPQLAQQGWDWVQLASRQLASDAAQLAALLVELIDSDALSAYEGSEERKLLEQAFAAAGPDAWMSAMDRIVDGGWRLGFAGRGWLAGAVDVPTAKAWVDGNPQRARVLASTAAIGGDRISEVTRFLLEEFGDDDEIASALVGEFISGTWWGPESERIASQIDQVQGWIDEPGQARAVTKWARKLVRYLEGRRRDVLQREAEERW